MPKSPVAVPTKVNGRYEIKDAPIGQGGMGVVYRAYDTVTKRFVALKTMFGDADPAALELFEREWTVLASLSHPNIVDILDTGEWAENGQRKPYFVMPLLPGQTLDQLIKTSSQRLTVERTVEIIFQSCRGLQAAHDKGLVHRDLKPSNIFVMDDDTVKIIDFGVVHLAGANSITGIKGTLQYMAPEQLEMKPANAQSDIFSLAVVSYEALTGRKAFARKTEAEVVEAIRTHIPPPASEINPSINQMISRTVHKGMAKQPWHRFTNAREFGDTLQKALRGEAIERFDRGKIQPRIERVKRAFAESDHQFAMEILTELESEGHIDPDMTVLRIQIEQGVRQKNIRQLLESARTRMEEEEFPLALQKIGDVLSIDPANRDAQNLRSQIERQRSENQIDNWFRLARQHRDNKLYSQARQALQEILKIDSSNAQARQMLAEIDQTEQESIKLREEKQRLYEAAVASYRGGEISTALSQLERILDINRRTSMSITPDLDAQCQSFYNQVRSERDAARNAYAEGRKHLLDRNIAKALEICDEYLRKHPADPMFQALKLEAEETQRQQQSAAVAEVNRRAEAEPDLDKKYNIIKEAVEKYPHEPHFKSSLKLIRERRDLVNSIVNRAQQYEERGQFNDAAGQWDILRNIYPVYPGLDFELERLGRRKQDQLRAEAKARWMERIDSHFNAGEYAKARDVIKDALDEFKEDKELQGLRSLAEQAVKRSAEAHLLLKKGRDLCAAQDFDQGLGALRDAQRLDPRHPAVRATLLGSLVQHARATLPHDWRAAEPLVQEALELDPADPVARNLSSIVEDYRRQEDINSVLVQARNLQGDGNIPDALQHVERGLATYPNEVRLSQLYNNLRGLAGEMETWHDSVPTVAAPDQTSPPDPSSTVPAHAFDDDPPPLPEFPVPQPPAQPSALPAAKRSSWLWGAVAAAVLLLLTLGFLLFRHQANSSRPLPAPQLADVQLQLTSNITGANFTIDGKPADSSAPRLSPGNHTIEAAHEGYLSEARSITVSQSSPQPLPVAFTLSPVLAELRVSTALENGALVLDSDPPLPLQEGAVTRDGISLAEHTVKILAGGKEVFSFGFQASPKQPIVLTGPLASRLVQGIVVSSLSGAGKVYATPGLRGGVAGQDFNLIPPTGIDVAAGLQPPQRFVVDDKTGKLREITFDPSPLPLLTVLLAGAPDKVPVTITSNVPGCTLVVNGQPSPRPIDGRTRLLSLTPGSYAVKLTHAGYQDAPEQKIQLKASDSSKHIITFTLAAAVAAKMATLSIAAAPPDSGVYIDSIREGTVNAAGVFIKEVAPGSHLIALKKEGFEDFKETRSFNAGDTMKLSGESMKALATFVLKVSPAAARLSVQRAGDAAPTPIANGQSLPLRAGAYTVSAELEKYKNRSEALTVEPGKPVSLDWTLQPIEEKQTALPFDNPSSWSESNGWSVHSAEGYSFLRDTLGTYQFEILMKSKQRVFTKSVKKINFVAEFKDSANRVSYTLDGKNLTRKAFEDNVPGQEVKVPHGMEGNQYYTLIVELAPDSVTIKTAGGKLLDKIERSGKVGKFGFLGEVELTVYRK